jgi:hypothetical protein
MRFICTGGDEDFTSPLFQTFKAAKKDIAQGAMLPLEVLEGIRSIYHKAVSQNKLLDHCSLGFRPGRRHHRVARCS